MNDEDRGALNRRVAVVLGHTAAEMGRGWALTLHGVPVSILRFSDESGAWSQCLDYCGNPAAADLVRVEIKRRGWMLTRIDYRSKRALPAYPSQHRAQILTDKAINSDGHWGASDDSPHEALCLAFLAAHDAEQDAKT